MWQDRKLPSHSVWEWVSSMESTLSLGGMRRLSTVGEEVEGVRQEVLEVKGEEKGEIKVEGEPLTS